MNRKAKNLLEHLGRLSTEKPNPQSLNLDRLTAVEICRIINSEDKTVSSAVEKQIPQIAATAEKVLQTLQNGGRLFYIGAGTSGRLGVLDAAECPPTFGTDPDQIIGVIAGGHPTLVRSAEGIEDRDEEAPRDLERFGLSKKDMVIGLAASVQTPYTLAGIEYARKIGAATALIVCNKADNLEINPDILIELDVGPEVVTGSTRMKSGTAQKMALNIISTTAMVLSGKCFGNLMVDLQATSDKLTARSRKILMEILEISYDEADGLLQKSRGSVKTAIAMYKLGIERAEAEKKLVKAGGFLWKILEQGDEKIR